jgi:RNA recognition motif-containing protein
MSFTVFLGNLPIWVTADDIKSWLAAEGLVADQIKVIRNPETQESKGFAFIDAPNNDEMQAIIRRFDRAPLEDRLLRANPAQPPKARKPGGPFTDSQAQGRPQGQGGGQGMQSTAGPMGQGQAGQNQAGQGQGAGQGLRRRRERGGKRGKHGPQSDFAEQLAKAL